MSLLTLERISPFRLSYAVFAPELTCEVLSACGSKQSQWLQRMRDVVQVLCFLLLLCMEQGAGSSAEDGHAACKEGARGCSCLLTNSVPS